MEALLAAGHGLRHVVDRALDLALPPCCAGCGTEGAVLCTACTAALLVRRGAAGGLPLGLPSDVPAPLLQLEWCAPFAGPVRRALHALKYGGERRVADPLGGAVAARWGAVAAGGDVLVPVPVHEARARDRGYDQAVLIAEAAAASLGLPAVRALDRARATVAQYHLDRAARAANVAAAFRLRDEGRAVVKGRWIVLVDDIVTTGATLAACAEVLLAAGSVGVSAVTVARER